MAGRDGHVCGARDPRRHLHRQGRGRDASAAGTARRRRRAGADLPCQRPAAAALLRPRAGRRAPVEGADAAAHRQLAAEALPLPAGRGPRHRDRVGQEPAHPCRPVRGARRRPGRGAAAGPDGPRVSASTSSARRSAGSSTSRTCSSSTIRMYDEDANAVAEFRSRCGAITVDEFQDVNLLQQELLERWLGPREELCVVGDDYQAIYGFTGASPRHLLALRERFAAATVVTLEENYRSSPQVLELANRLTPKLGGAPKTLRAVRDAGPEPVVRPFATREAEAGFVVEQIRALATEGVPYAEVAILFRLNARSEPWEEALAEAEIPYQVRGGPFLARPAARRLRQVIGGSQSTALARRRAARGDRRRLGPGRGARARGRVRGHPPARPRTARRARSSARRRRPHRLVVLRRARPALRRGLGRRGSAPAHVPPGEGARVRGRLSALPSRSASSP